MPKHGVVLWVDILSYKFKVRRAGTSTSFRERGAMKAGPQPSKICFENANKLRRIGAGGNYFRPGNPGRNSCAKFKALQFHYFVAHTRTCLFCTSGRIGPPAEKSTPKLRARFLNAFFK
jgi:hypothetical protein